MPACCPKKRTPLTWLLPLGIALALLAFTPSRQLEPPQARERSHNGASKTPITLLLDDYLHIKDALVASNTWGAALAASRILLTLHNLPPQPHPRWPAFQSTLRRAADQISGTPNLTIQRTHFKPLSEALIAAIPHAGIGDTTLYTQYCPMAHEGRGAYWLSRQPEIHNPYFGTEMLHCGRTVATHASTFAAAPIPPGTLPGALKTNHVHGCHGVGQ